MYAILIKFIYDKNLVYKSSTKWYNIWKILCLNGIIA